MLIKLRKRMAREESGFTLVELLVVMLILGILAAIAIPTFFNQRDKARDAEAKTGARTGETAMETYGTENSGNYTPSGAGATLATLTTRLKKIEPTLNDLPGFAVTAANADTAAVDEVLYTVEATSSTGNKFSITRLDNGTKTVTCSTQGEDGCPTGGNWAQ